MTLQLTSEQRQALREHRGEPLYVVDTDAGSTYVLLSAEVYDRVRPLMGGDRFDVAETYPLQEQAVRDVWSDPAMDVYNDYDVNRRS